MENKNNNVVDIPVSELILCKNGWCKVEDVNINDDVYGIDGNLHKVKDIKLKKNQDIYLIKFKDRTSVKLGNESIVRVATRKQEHNMKKYKDLRFKYVVLTDLLKDLDEQENFKNKSIHNRKYSCLPILPIKYNDINNLPLDPYLFGLLLGDGGFTGNNVTFTNAEDDIIKEFENMISKIGLEPHYKHFENHDQLYICSKNNYSENFLNTKLRQLKLFGLDSRQKFIPDIYKKSSIQDRLLLLSGIINTDGHIGKNSTIKICTYSPQMYKDIKDMCRSLGLRISFSEFDRTSEYSTKKYDKEIEYEIRIYEDDFSKFKLSEKHSYKIKDRKKFVNKIVDIQKIDNKDTVSIILDNDEKVVLNNYIAL